MQNFDGEIKIKSWIKRIKINERGEYLEFNLSDANMLSNLLKFIETAKQGVLELHNEIDGKEDLEKIEKTRLYNKQLAKMTDDVFGENTCLKIFNTNTPYADDIILFLDQLINVLTPHINERQKQMHKIGETYIDKANKRRDTI